MMTVSHFNNMDGMKKYLYLFSLKLSNFIFDFVISIRSRPIIPDITTCAKEVAPREGAICRNISSRSPCSFFLHLHWNCSIVLAVKFLPRLRASFPWKPRCSVLLNCGDRGNVAIPWCGHLHIKYSLTVHECGLLWQYEIRCTCSIPGLGGIPTYFARKYSHMLLFSRIPIEFRTFSTPTVQNCIVLRWNKPRMCKFPLTNCLAKHMLHFYQTIHVKGFQFSGAIVTKVSLLEQKIK